MPIEQVAPECVRIVDVDQEVEWLASGFGSDGSAFGLPWWPAEGQVWWQEGGYILFSDIWQSKRLKGAPGGVPDGMKVDLDGNLYCTGPRGVWIIDPSGKHLGTIALGDGKRATNVEWGGGDWKTLFITTFHELARVRMMIPGVPVPRRI